MFLTPIRAFSGLLLLLLLWPSVSLAQEPLRPNNILYFSRYTSSGGNPQSRDTQINLTNTSQSEAVKVHLYFVANNSWTVADSSLLLTPAQTVSFLVSEIDPDVTGRLYAVAVNPNTGLAAKTLTGTSYLRQGGLTTSETASPVAALPPGIEEGQLENPSFPISAPKPGSVLFFTRYISAAGNPGLSDTRISLSHGGSSTPITVHLFLVDGSTCSVADFYVNLGRRGGTSFLMSELDPGVEGYLVAIAYDENGPVQSNTLTGSAMIRETDGRTATLPAIPFAKLSPGNVTPNAEGEMVLKFNGMEYERLPNTLAVTSFNSQETDTSYLSLLSPASNLLTGASAEPLTNIFALLYNDLETPFSSGLSVGCYLNGSLTELFDRNGGLNRHVPAGRTGWLHLSGRGRPLLGAIISQGTVFNGGHNLHQLGFLSSYSITVPN